MGLLRHGVDRSVIALGPGDESVDTTQVQLLAFLQGSDNAELRNQNRGEFQDSSGIAPPRYSA